MLPCGQIVSWAWEVFGQQQAPQVRAASLLQHSEDQALMGAISGTTVELDIKAVFRNNVVVTSAGGHQ